MMKWKLLFIILISSTVIPGEQNKVKSCAGGYDSIIADISLFQFDSSLIRKFESFLPNQFEEPLFFYGEANEDSLNISEWRKYFGGKLSWAETESLVYSAGTDSLKQIISQSNNVELTEACKYILLLRDSSLISRRYQDEWYWEYHPKIDSTTYNSSIVKCKEGLKNSTSDFLKLRYAYLTLRGLRFNYRFDECIDWYEKVILPLHPKGTLKYRSMQYYGGALYHSNRIAEANYVFSKVFDEYPPRAGQAAFDFRLQERADWDSLLALTKSSREKEVVYFLYGRSDPKEALTKIIGINPESEFIPLLLIRLVNNVEDGLQEISRIGLASGSNWYDTFIGNGYYSETDCYACIFGTSKLNTEITREEAAKFVSEIASQKKLTERQLWLSAAAYLNMLTNHLPEANKFIQESIPLLQSNPEWSNEVKVLQIIYEVRSLSKIDEAAESRLYTIFESPELNKTYENQYGDQSIIPANRYCMQLISDKYLSQGDLLKAELCSQTDNRFYKDSTLQRLQQMKKFMLKQNRSVWEDQLMKKYGHPLRDIVESISCIKLYEHKFIDALKELEIDSTAGQWELNADPFVIHIIDCHDCDAETPHHTTYTLRQFVKRMIDLRKQISQEKDKEKKAELCLIYANGLYNMSHSGNSRVVSVSMITYMALDGISYTNNAGPGIFYNDYYTRYYGNYGAEYWYNQAALNATNPELKAQCTWMLAKAQLANFYLTEQYKDGETDFIAFPAYQKLKSDLSNTAYYREVIRQCEYFAKYAR